MLSTAEIPGRRWYYTMEILPGQFTKGVKLFTNLALSREFRRHIDLAGKSCIDIGSQEGVGSIGMKRQGADLVVAYDRHSLTEYINTAKEAYAADFHYVAGLTLNLLKDELARRGLPTSFDFVNFAGVLYHMIDPIAGLVMARSLLREGGIMLLETAVNSRNDFTADVNHHGALYKNTNYFQLSVPIIDYWTRLLRLEALDCAWIGAGDIKRFILIARAVNTVLPEKDDEWMRKSFFEVEFDQYGLKFPELRSDRPPVGYAPSSGVRRIYREKPNGKLMDLHATCTANGLFPIDKDLQVMRLSDQF